MRWIILFLSGFLLVTAFESVSALDINPSKNVLPSSTWDSGGNHFSIFNGDPKRIQRANAVDPKAFDAHVEITPNPLSLRAVKMVGPNPSIKITFSVHNHAKKSYTLSFPTAQRWDFRILNSSGGLVYAYTNDHDFVQTVGISMVNHDEKLVYTEDVAFDDMSLPLTPGTYTVQAVLANYPEVTGQTQLVVQD